MFTGFLSTVACDILSFTAYNDHDGGHVQRVARTKQAVDTFGGQPLCPTGFLTERCWKDSRTWPSTSQFEERSKQSPTTSTNSERKSCSVLAHCHFSECNKFETLNYSFSFTSANTSCSWSEWPRTGVCVKRLDYQDKKWQTESAERNETRCDGLTLERTSEAVWRA